MDFVAIGGSSWVSVCLGRFYWSQLDLRLKTIRVDLHRFYRKFIFVVDLGRFYTISTIWQIGVDSDIWKYLNLVW